MTVETFPGAGITAGHPRYLPPTDESSGPDDCDATAPGAGYICTRPHEHDGDHAAHGQRGRQFARWPQEAA